MSAPRSSNKSTTAGKYLFTGGFVATLDESLGEFPDGAVLVENGVITQVGKAKEIVAPDAEIIDCTDGVVIPGMVDTHRHVSMSLTRGLGADQSLFHFLSNTYMRWLPATKPEDMYTSALVGALEAIDSGVTTILDSCETFHGHKEAVAELEGLKDSGVRAFYCYGMSDHSYDDFEQGMAGWNARMAHLKELREANLDNELVRVGVAISQPGTVPFDLMKEEIHYAEEHKMLTCSHSATIKNSNITRGLYERYDRGLMRPGHVYIHCCAITPDEADLIRKTGGKVSIATETEMQMGMGIPPIRMCIEHGLNPSLSVDTSAAVAPDLLSQMRLALQLQRCLDNDSGHAKNKMPLDVDFGVRDALIWGTRNGAEAVGLGDKIGTLTPGKAADIVFISNKRALSASAFPLGTAVLHSTSADVDTVMINGQIKKRNGQLVGVDVDSIRAKAKAGLHRILEGLKHMRPEMNPSEIENFYKGAEQSSRVYFAQAYGPDFEGRDWLRAQ